MYLIIQFFLLQESFNKLFYYSTTQDTTGMIRTFLQVNWPSKVNSLQNFLTKELTLLSVDLD